MLVNVPVLVILGCAFVVTVPAVPAVPALVAAPLNAPTNVVAVIELFDKLAIKPVLVTSAILPVAAFAKIIKLFPAPADTLILSATLARATYKLGTSVVLVTVNGAVPVTTLLTKKLAVMLPAVAKLPDVVVPVTIKLVNVPTLVMLGCALVVTVAAEPVALPDNAPVNVVALTLPALMLPVTAKLVSVPVLVMFGCAFVVTVPAVVALVAAPLSAPTNVVAVIAPFAKLAEKLALDKCA